MNYHIPEWLTVLLGTIATYLGFRAKKLETDIDLLKGGKVDQTICNRRTDKVEGNIQEGLKIVFHKLDETQHILMNRMDGQHSAIHKRIDDLYKEVITNSRNSNNGNNSNG